MPPSGRLLSSFEHARPATRVATAVLAVGSFAGYAAAIQWPDLHRFAPAGAVATAAYLSIIVAAGAFALAGVVLVTEQGQRGTAWLFLLVGILYPLNIGYTWPHTPLPILSACVSPVYGVALGVVLLRYPHDRLQKQGERYLVWAAALWPVAGHAAVMLVTRPDMAERVAGPHGELYALPRSTWWVHVTSSARAGADLLNATQLGQVVLLVWFLVALHRRIRRESRLLRHDLLPVLIGSGLFVLAWCVFLAGVVLGGLATELSVELYLMMAIALITALIPIVFALSAARRQVSRIRVADLVVRLSRMTSAAQVRDELRTTLGDPQLDIHYWVEETDEFVDASGRAAEPIAHFLGARVPVYDKQGGLLAVVYADPNLQRSRSLLNSALAAAGLALENTRLEAALRAQLVEVRESRLHIVEAALAERRRMERDLHDGAQQRLLALGATVGRLEMHIESAPARNILLSLREELRAARSELRDLARGIHPALLADQGLGPAIEAVAERLPLAVTVHVSDARWPLHIEATIYFVACEALTNATKHAHASRAEVSCAQVDGRLRLDVVDDGSGGAMIVHGSGLAGLRDRVRALGGELGVDSAPAAGTHVWAELLCE